MCVGFFDGLKIDEKSHPGVVLIDKIDDEDEAQPEASER